MQFTFWNVTRRMSEGYMEHITLRFMPNGVVERLSRGASGAVAAWKRAGRWDGPSKTVRFSGADRFTAIAATQLARKGWSVKGCATYCPGTVVTSRRTNRFTDPETIQAVEAGDRKAVVVRMRRKSLNRGRFGKNEVAKRLTVDQMRAKILVRERRK